MNFELSPFQCEIRRPIRAFRSAPVSARLTRCQWLGQWLRPFQWSGRAGASDGGPAPGGPTE
jgi:hypothetical protein